MFKCNDWKFCQRLTKALVTREQSKVNKHKECMIYFRTIRADSSSPLTALFRNKVFQNPNYRKIFWVLRLVVCLTHWLLPDSWTRLAKKELDLSLFTMSRTPVKMNNQGVLLQILLRIFLETNWQRNLREVSKIMSHVYRNVRVLELKWSYNKNARNVILFRENLLLWRPQIIRPSWLEAWETILSQKSYKVKSNMKLWNGKKYPTPPLMNQLKVDSVTLQSSFKTRLSSSAAAICSTLEGKLESVATKLLSLTLKAA